MQYVNRVTTSEIAATLNTSILVNRLLADILVSGMGCVSPYEGIISVLGLLPERILIQGLC